MCKASNLHCSTEVSDLLKVHNPVNSYRADFLLLLKLNVQSTVGDVMVTHSMPSKKCTCSATESGAKGKSRKWNIAALMKFVPLIFESQGNWVRELKAFFKTVNSNFKNPLDLKQVSTGSREFLDVTKGSQSLHSQQRLH